MLFSGYFDLPWWGYVLVALAFTHVTIAAVTIYLHRCQTHRAMDLHPVPSYFFRIWLWMTTGMMTKEWVAIHRKHHAKVETPEDPHSPQVHGINKVLWAGVLLYVKESHHPETMQRYGHGTPDDWLEKNVFTKYTLSGITLMGVIDVLLFGIVPGVLILVTQIAWIPFWAAGVINGVGHFFGYRNWDVPAPDASRNMIPWGIVIGGEELHNNHHAFPSSAKFSAKWYEFDIGWIYIRIMESLGLATVKKVLPVPRFAEPKPTADLQTLQAVIANRYDVLKRYTASLKHTYAQELERLGHRSREAEVLRKRRRALLRAEQSSAPEVAEALKSSEALSTAVTMRAELIALWERSSASSAELVHRLEDWCRRAEASGVAPLADFSRRLRCYA